MSYLLGTRQGLTGFWSDTGSGSSLAEVTDAPRGETALMAVLGIIPFIGWMYFYCRVWWLAQESVFGTSLGMAVNFGTRI